MQHALQHARHAIFLAALRLQVGLPAEPDGLHSMEVEVFSIFSVLTTLPEYVCHFPTLCFLHLPVVAGSKDSVHPRARVHCLHSL